MGQNRPLVQDLTAACTTELDSWSVSEWAEDEEKVGDGPQPYVSMNAL
jgi:hypothetical protein